ncbi:MAG TPA: single-stranded DNA-binding protein [Planctomycetaceae bacterium]|nr:single-stranded DNA-binding protein [Planctomycetaceae bacterium]HQZ64004.1 single-stranded DNA-binding protein [Planctomycetaceae bacterium]HRA87501.1 single-stranded DNA-binding protein [Planctomycetaceae bacterium]
MASFNKVILVGNLTRDPEVRYIPSGTAVCDVGLAVNSQWTDRKTNERKEEVTFIDVTLWGRTAEIAGEYLAKGRPVLIEGRLHLDSWEDKESGQKRSKLKVIGESLQMLGSRDGGGSGGSGSGGGSAAAGGGAARGPSRPAAAPSRPAANRGTDNRVNESGGNDRDAEADSYRTPDQAFYDDMPSGGGDEVPF